MKKISILLIALVVSITSQAQNVNTSPDNKKAILEEFTGQKCQYCPDGHKIGNDLAKANPGKIFLINIHSGGYATPDATYTMDLRTTVGTAIDGAAGITGYPAGSVNRVKSPWASNRGAWASEAAAILAEPSPVNVWCKSSVDKDTRLLTTEVEVYYTANGTGTSNKLSVAVLQDGILGDQIGGTTWNPTNYVNGKYVHNHVLRMHQTSTSWGASLDTLTAGKLYKRTYYTVLPANVGNIPLDIYSLKVVAFVAEANNKILSGYETNVYTNDPNKFDLSFVDKTVFPVRVLMDPDPKWCTDKITPKIEVTNLSFTTVTSFDVTATIAGQTFTKTFTGSLPQGGKTTVDFGEKTIAGDGYVLYTSAGFSKINGSSTIVDSKLKADTFSSAFISFKNNAITSSANFTQDFENSALSAFKSLVYDRNDGTNIGMSTWAAAHGAENTNKATFISLYQVNQETGHIVMGKVNLNGATESKLSFHYAYQDDQPNGTLPTINLSYSTDCGINWTEVSGSSFQPTETGVAPTPGQYYIPKSADYVKKEFDLISLKNKEFLLRISVKTGQDGNALYIDQISLKNSGSGGSGASVDTFQVKVFKVTTAPKSSEDIYGGVSMTKDSMYTWKITNVSMPSGWTFLTICDAVDCVNYPGTQRNTFKAKGNPTLDIYKLTIDHAKTVGYGSVSLKAWRGKDSTSTTLAKDLKFSLLTSNSSSISVVSDLEDKLLYYFDNKVFVDREFTGANLEVFDIKGQMVLNAKVKSDNIDFSPLNNGIYIARISKDGEILKSHKFSTAK